ncbi:sporulation protein [Aquibacillus rhizosphaerae]|uniref:Sporulation protein n=1 Tax=Aquibacillus rhizosphaerae TaxID=3051431 RepID=A0ABT7L8A1_9BACI|nr:sporulation protein [Aquibacillus sp. LR5S19]MDL4842094.1 sporulation protein [Aquibacillus sp. LR5S19]
MLKKWLASVGIGNTKIDTQLDDDKLIPGEIFSGKVVMQGGNTEQQVDRIYLYVMTEALRERDDKKFYEKVVLEKFALADFFTIGAGENREVEFNFTLPLNTPPTLGRTKVWIQTGLDVPAAIDPKDIDFLSVEAHPTMRTVLDALTNELDFQLYKVDMEYSKRYDYIQEFEFRPSREFRADLDELEVYFFLASNQVELVLQVDRRAKGIGGFFAEALEMDESYTRLTLSHNELEQGTAYVADRLRDTIRQFI